MTIFFQLPQWWCLTPLSKSHNTMNVIPWIFGCLHYIIIDIMFDFNESLSLGYLKVKIDGMPIPKGRLVKGPKINQYVWTVSHLLSNGCIFSLTRVIQKKQVPCWVWSFPFVLDQAFALILCAQATCLDSRIFFCVSHLRRRRGFWDIFFWDFMVTWKKHGK